MLIKKPLRHPFLNYLLKLRRKKIVIICAILFLVVIYSTGLLIVGGRMQKSLYLSYLSDIIKYRQNVLFNFTKGLFVSPDKLSIDIEFIDFKKLQFKRDLAVKKGVLIKDEDDYVTAWITYKETRYKVKLRLKGDWTDHLDGDKWSFRVKVKEGKTILGMKKFSLQHPKVRRYLHEWLFHKFLEKEGLLSLKYEFVSLQVNGKDWGIYAVEEHFDKRLLERQGMKEGPILKFSEDIIWNQVSKLPVIDGERMTLKFVNVDVYPDVFQLKKTLKDSSLKNQMNVGYGLLDAFNKEMLKMSDVFDVDSMAAFQAVCDVLGARHALVLHNRRFYYNPILSKLMPIGFDGLALASPFQSLPYNNLEYIDYFFKDNNFVKKYVSYLEMFASTEYMDEFFSDIRNELDEQKNILYKDFPGVIIRHKTLFANRKAIQIFLNPDHPLFVYFQHSDERQMRLSIGNRQSFPIEILGIYEGDKRVDTTDDPILISGSSICKPTKIVKYKDFVFNLKKNIKKPSIKLEVLYRLLGSSKTHRGSIFPYSRIDTNFVYHSYIRKESNVDQFPFLVKDHKARTITFKSGHWTLKEPLIIPENYRVNAYAGLHLDIEDNAMIFSRSPLLFKGSVNQPIIIKGNGLHSQGIAVIQAKEGSFLENVYFEKLGEPRQKSWGLTGAITFYESPVTINQCVFSDNNSEDALNIVRSDFSLMNSVFKYTFSDALDLDFSNGTIQNCSIYKAGNDGIDVSGSQVNLQRIIIDGAEDKGISAGEGSNMHLQDIIVKNVEVAFASKDNSFVKADTVRVSSAKVGFVVYQKKSEYGPGNMVITDGIENNINIRTLIEARSSLILNGTKMPVNTKKVVSILYGKKYGKATK